MDQTKLEITLLIGLTFRNHVGRVGYGPDASTAQFCERTVRCDTVDHCCFGSVVCTWARTPRMSRF